MISLYLDPISLGRGRLCVSLLFHGVVIMSTVIGSQYDYFYCCSLQKFLNQNCQGLTKDLGIDGNCGPLTGAALQQYQTQVGLPATGVYDAATQAQIEPTLLSKYIQLSDVRSAATTLGVTVPTVVTVCQTETAGSGFNDDGSCAILFERHKFYAQLQAAGMPATQLAQLVIQQPNIVNPIAGGYMGGPAEWQRFNLASQINPEAAKMSISMGLFQIMGYWFVDCGYASVDAYYHDMIQNEKLQLSAFVCFIQKNSGGLLWNALKAHNWTSFAQLYNGPANVAVYSQRLQTNYTNSLNIS
jgi:peptidoglycan hydrolase-like protein with peptidoglycan-binding domain